MPSDALLVFVGGGIGSVLRYAVGLCIGAAAFPWATLAVNICGSLAIGLFGGWSERFAWTEPVRLAYDWMSKAYFSIGPKVGTAYRDGLALK